MLSPKDLAIVYETLLSSPGMNDAVKITVNITRKNVLLLTKVIEAGLLVKDEPAQGGFLSMTGNEAMEQLRSITEDLLGKAGLVELNAKLNSLQSK